MTISFQPKRRASREKAPGPRRAIAAETAINWVIANFESEKLHNCGGNQERAIPRHSMPTRGLNIGVRKPMRMKMPLSRRNAADRDRAGVTRSDEDTQRIP
jgi:hypothetical protein